MLPVSICSSGQIAEAGGGVPAAGWPLYPLPLWWFWPADPYTPSPPLWIKHLGSGRNFSSQVFGPGPWPFWSWSTTKNPGRAPWPPFSQRNDRGPRPKFVCSWSTTKRDFGRDPWPKIWYLYLFVTRNGSFFDLPRGSFFPKNCKFFVLFPATAFWPLFAPKLLQKWSKIRQKTTKNTVIIRALIFTWFFIDFLTKKWPKFVQK